MSVIRHVAKMCVGMAFGLAVLSAEVHAQSVSLQPPSLKLVDGNGVDLIGGNLTIEIPSISAGGGGSGIARLGSGYNLPYGDNLTGVLNTGTDTTRGSYTTVSIGGSSEKFFGSGTSFTSETGTPDSLSCASNICTYTTADGTVALFDQTLTSNIGIRAGAGAVTQITKPDGEVLKFYYKRVVTTSYITPLGQNAVLMGLKSVTSSLGWMVKYELATGTYVIKPTKVYILNTAIDYCDPTLEGACTNTANSSTWPTLVLGGSGSTITYTQILNAGLQTGPVTTLTTANDSSTIPVTLATGLTSPTGISESASFTGTVVNSVTVGGQTWTYGYNTSGTFKTTTVTNPAGGRRIVISDTATSHALSDQDEMGRLTKYAYDSSGRLSQIIHPDAVYSGTTLTGGYTQYTYNSRGNLTDVTEYGKDGTSLTSHADYSTTCSNTKTCNKPNYVTVPAAVTGSPATITTTYTYDFNSGNLATESKPAVGGVTPQVRYTYNQITPQNTETGGSPGTLAAGTPVWRLTSTSTCMSSNWTGSACAGGSADEARTTIAYANNNVLPTSITKLTGNGSASVTTTMTYDSMGNVKAADGPISGTNDAIYTFYDLLNREIGQIGKLGQTARKAMQITYNASGQVTAATSGSTSGTDASALAGMTVLESVATTYSGTTGLPTIQTHTISSAGTVQNIAEIAYDSLLRVKCSALRMNGATNSNACTLTSGSSTDRITATTYNAASQVISTVSGYGTSNARQDFVRAYNTNGSLASISDDKGQTTGYSYDTYNRLIKTCYPSKTSSGVISTDCRQTGYTGAVPTTLTLRDGTVENLSYDPDGRLSARSATGVSEAFSYNNFNQITSHTNNGVTETLAYHPLWGVTSDTQSVGTVSYTYDAFGRRSQLTYPAYGGVPFSLAYSYSNDDAVQNESVSYNSGAAVLQAAFGEDSFGRLSSIASGPASAVVSTRAYSTTTGQLSQLSNNLAGISYDSLLAYGYNAANQIISRTQTGSSTYNYAPTINSTTNYTLNGQNQVTAVNSASLSYDSLGNLYNDGAVTYTFNKDNLLTATSSGATLAYDAANRLLSVTKAGTTTSFLYDGTNLIAEYNGSTLLRRYVHGPGSDQPVIWFEGTNDSTPRYLAADQQGSVTAVTDSSGNAIAAYAYNEYGLPSQTLGSLTSRFLYTGQVWLPEVGLYNYKNRLYAPSIGRFMQTDPVGYGDGLNWYNYVHGDPVNGLDSLGLGDDSTTVIVEGTRNPFAAWDKFESHGGLCGMFGGAACGGFPNVGPFQYCTTCYQQGGQPAKDPKFTGSKGCQAAKSILYKTGKDLKNAGEVGTYGAYGSFAIEAFGGEALGPGDAVAFAGSGAILEISSTMSTVGSAMMGLAEGDLKGAATDVLVDLTLDKIGSKIGGKFLSGTMPKAVREEGEKALKGLSGSLFGKAFSAAQSALKEEKAECEGKKE